MNYKKIAPIFAALLPLSVAAQNSSQPNFVIIFCDDMGYGDLGCYGSPSILTPNIDRMAAQGQKWSSFYVGASVSTPSRAALLTGRYPARSGMTEVLIPDSQCGLPQTEITMAKLLKQKDYTTACVGKWHLGHKAQYLPTKHGFDYFYGIPYSNDMSRKEQELMGVSGYPHKLPFFDQDSIIEYEPDQTQLTQRVTNYAVNFINTNKEHPFFLYLAHPMPHIPVYASDKFKGTSLGGKYGDAIEELDWSVGQILETLTKNGLDKNTLVIFASDNGPWLITKSESGSAGGLRDGKASAYEGGFRVPCIFWGESFVKPLPVNEMGSMFDILPTICELANIDRPKDRLYDGASLAQVLQTGKNSPRNNMIYYRYGEIYAARVGNYKAIFATKPAYGPGDKISYETPELYDLGSDPAEKYNVADDYPHIVRQIEEVVDKHNESLKQF